MNDDRSDKKYSQDQMNDNEQSSEEHGNYDSNEQDQYSMGTGDNGDNQNIQDDAVNLEKIVSEHAEFKDRWLRAEAELRNLRQRSAKELSEARSYAISRFAGDVLTVADNLQMALSAFGKSSDNANISSQAKALHEGVQVTERELERILSRHGVKKIEAQEQKFNPHIHQAMFEVPTNDKPAGCVVEVVQTGYQIGERVLRPAMVGVAKAMPGTTDTVKSANDKDGDKDDDYGHSNRNTVKSTNDKDGDRDDDYGHSNRNTVKSTNDKDGDRDDDYGHSNRNTVNSPSPKSGPADQTKPGGNSGTGRKIDKSV